MHPSANIETMQARAAARGGKCLSKRYAGSQTNLRWQCERGHVWWATPASVSTGRWCASCRRETLEVLHKVAAARGGKCLSKRCPDSYTRLRWKCRNGHIWRATSASIKTGRWCRKCGGATLQDMQALAAFRGGKCLSKAYRNSSGRLRWQCATAHRWYATGGEVMGGTWCPRCDPARRKWRFA